MVFQPTAAINFAAKSLFALALKVISNGVNPVPPENVPMTTPINDVYDRDLFLGPCFYSDKGHVVFALDSSFEYCFWVFENDVFPIATFYQPFCLKLPGNVEETLEKFGRLLPAFVVFTSPAELFESVGV